MALLHNCRSTTVSTISVIWETKLTCVRADIVNETPRGRPRLATPASKAHYISLTKFPILLLYASLATSDLTTSFSLVYFLIAHYVPSFVFFSFFFVTVVYFSHSICCICCRCIRLGRRPFTFYLFWYFEQTCQ